MVAAGCGGSEIYLSLQEYFERLGENSERWEKTVSRAPRAFSAQLGLGVAAIGGKTQCRGLFLIWTCRLH